MGELPLLSVPNFSEGRRGEVIEAIAAAAVRARARVLDVHADPDHHRSVLTLAGPPGQLAVAVRDAAAEAIRHLDLDPHRGVHPRVGTIDVAPVVHLTSEQRGAACAEALVLGDLLGDELGLPVFLYGQLAGGRTRAELRSGGPERLAERIQSGELRPDFGPPRLRPGAGAVLVAARPPLVAFNVELAPTATLDHARWIASLIREGGEEGLPGVRALGLWLPGAGRAQVSTNIEDPSAVTAADVVAAVAKHARPTAAELVGLAPAAALAGFPAELALRGRRTIEEALRG